MEDWDTDAILQDALSRVEEDSRERGYFAAVPRWFQSAVQYLAELNFPFYEEAFERDFQAFREQMARNWLVKHRAFASLAKRAGLEQVPRIRTDPDPRSLSEVSVALLTINASYLLAGPGCFDPSGRGATFRYRRIPLREGEAVEDAEGPAGFHFKGPLEVGLRASSNLVTTSILVSLFAASLPPELARRVTDELDGALTVTFTRADESTLHGRQRYLPPPDLHKAP